MRIVIFAFVKTHTQISCTVTAQQISTFVFTTWIVQFLFFLNPKISSFYPSSTAGGQFVPDLVGNPKDRFSCVAAQVMGFRPIGCILH